MTSADLIWPCVIPYDLSRHHGTSADQPHVTPVTLLWPQPSCCDLQWFYQGWEFAHWFSERIACFLPKNEQIRDFLKKISNSLIFGERPERFAHDRSFSLSDLSKSLMVAHFFVSDLSDSLTSLTKKEEMSDSLIFSIKKLYIKHTKKQDFRFF